MNIRGEKDPWDTPCNGQCPIFGDDCHNCGRTAKERELWGLMSREERTKVNERLKKNED